MIKERPILFSSPMVKAILEGKKTQTRRVIQIPKWMLPYKPDLENAYRDGHVFATGDYLKVPLTSGDWAGTTQRVFCPYGYPYDPTMLIERGSTKISDGLEQLDMQPMKPEDADRLWVRESWWRDQSGGLWMYKADDGDWPPSNCGGKAMPSIFMPRWASRITLEIIGVRVERVQDISEADAIAEGSWADKVETWWQGYRRWEIKGMGEDLMHQQTTGDNPPDWMIEPHKLLDRPDLRTSAKRRYGIVWDHLNGKKYPWSSNPWVWVIEFKKVEAVK